MVYDFLNMREENEAQNKITPFVINNQFKID